MVYVSSSCIKKSNIVEVIRLLAQNGITNIELSGGTNYYDGIDYDLKKLKEEYHLQYACHAYFPPPKIPFVVNLASCNDEIYKKSVEHYDRCIELLKRINCNVLSVHAGFLTEVGEDEIGKKLQGKVLYSENEAYDRFCSAYKKLSEKCEKENIRLYLENNVLSLENYEAFARQNYFLMTDYKSIIHMRERINFNLLLDLGHLYVSTHTLGLDFERECHQLKTDVRWLHISENNGFQDEHRPLKRDSAILKQFYRILRPDINVTLETVSGIDDILESMDLAGR